MKKLLPFLMALAMLPAVAFGESEDPADLSEDKTGTKQESPDVSSFDEEDSPSRQGETGNSAESTDETMGTNQDGAGGTQEGEARETPFDEDEGSATNMGQEDDVDLPDEGEATREGTPESIEDEEDN